MTDTYYYTYIMASRPNGAIYIGVTSDLVKRCYEHRIGAAESHTKRYNIKQLIYTKCMTI